MHNDYTLLMSMLLDGEASPAEEAALREHLRACASCAEVWERWQAVSRRLAAAPMIAPAADLTEKVMARLQAHELRRRRLRWLGSGLFGSWLAISLASLLIVSGLVFWGIRNPRTVNDAVFASLQVLDGASWVLLGIWRLLSSLGAPTLAAGVGVLSVLTCAAGMLWLWYMGRSGRLLNRPIVAM